MERDDTLVSKETLETTFGRFSDEGLESMLGALTAAEPHLGTFLTENAARVAGKLALCGAPRSIVRGVHQDLPASAVLVYLAVRQGTYQIWEDTALAGHFLPLEGGDKEGGSSQKPDDQSTA